MLSVAEQVFPTKGNLIKAKHSLYQAQLGYELMDRKRNILIREMMNLSDKAKELRGTIEKTFDEAYKSLQSANVMTGVNVDVSGQIPPENGIEISYPDPYVPSLPTNEVKKEELPEISSRRIFVFERASTLELLSGNNETFAFSSPVSDEILNKYGLVMKNLSENNRKYKDLLIHRKDYVHSELDDLFIECVIASKRRIIG